MDVPLLRRRSTGSYNKDGNALKVKFAFFIIGLINNSGYVIILSASDTLAKEFKMEEYMSLFSGALVLFGLLVKALNSRFLVKIRHKIRLGWVIFFWILGILLICLAESANSFDMSLLGVIFVGIGTSLGDITNQGFIKGFQPNTILGYASGTGFAGIFGSLYYTVLIALGFTLEITLITLFILHFIFFITFLWVIQMKTENDYGRVSDLEMRKMIEEKEADVNDQISMTNIVKMAKSTFYYYTNLGLVYFFEYSIISYLASKAVSSLHPGSFFNEHAFEIIQILYQVGVFISRSSLSLIKIKRIWAITICQFAAFSAFVVFSQAELTDPTLLFIVVFMVGIFGGLSYVNSYFLLLEDENIPKKEKEIGLNIVSSFCDIGILISSFIGLLVLKKKN